MLLSGKRLLDRSAEVVKVADPNLGINNVAGSADNNCVWERSNAVRFEGHRLRVFSDRQIDVP